jgi:BASS family bile acid:Na+ symporter
MGGGMSVALLVGVIVPVAVIIVMLAVGLNLRVAAVRESLRHPRSLVACTLLQIVLLPVATLLLIALVAPPPPMAIVMFALAISPGGGLSNVFTHLARGNLALSVMMTIATTLLVAATAPVAAGLASVSGLLPLGGVEALSPIGIAVDLLRAALLPIFLGILCAQFLPAFVERIRPAVDILCMVALVAVVTCSAIVAWPVVHRAGAEYLGYAALLSLVSLVVGSAVSSALPAEDRSACVIEFGIRNLPIALILAGGSGSSIEIVAFLLCYLFVNTTALLGLALLNRSVLRRRFA